MYIKKLVSIVLLITSIHSGNILANSNSSQKIYPPYPEVWGYDVSNSPSFISGGGTLRAFKMKDGDIWFVVGHNFKYKNPIKRELGEAIQSEYLLIKFFKHEIIKLNEKEMDSLYDKINDNFLESLSKPAREIKFKDGSSLKRIRNPISKHCTIPNYINNYFLKLDYLGHQKKYSVLGAFPYIQLHKDEGKCEANAAPFIYQKLYFLGNHLIDLNDDTFILFSRDSNLILRFDQNLNTKFKPQNPTTDFNGNYINRNFFVIEYDLIEKLQDALFEKPLPLYQAVHDHLLLYFKEQYADKKLTSRGIQ